MTAIFTGLGAGAKNGSGNMLGGAGLLGGGTLGRSGEQVLLNAATGNLMIQQRDEMLVGRGPDDAVARTYNSQGDWNGSTWRMSTDRRVFGLSGTLNSANSIVRRTEADGTTIKYGWDSGYNAYVTAKGSGAYDTLSWNAGTSSWTWTDGDTQATETYGHASGTQYFITAETDTSGNALAFSYVAGTDKIDKVTTANGDYIQYGWSGTNITQITTVAGGTSTRTRYGYDGSGRLSSVSVDLTPDDNSIADGKVYTTTYSYVGTTNLVASITQSDGSSLAIGYDGSNRVHTLTQAVSSGASRTTTIDYYSGYSVVTDAAGQTTSLYYDLNGYLTQITAPPAYAGAAQQVTQFAYNANGDVTSVTDAMGNASAFTYDANGNLLTSTDRLGNVVTRTYGSKNELLTETSAGADATGAAVQHTTRYVYDSNDRLVFTLDAEGRVIEHRYDGYGQQWLAVEYIAQTYNVGALAANAAPTQAQMNAWVSALSDPTAISQQYYQYDARGNLTSSTDYGASTSPGAGSSALGTNTTSYTYDRAGQLLSRNTYQRVAETFVYDGLGRLTASVDIAGGTTSILFNDSAQSTVVTLASGVVQTSTYNLAGDLISFAESGSYTTVGTANAAYDQLGRARYVTDATGHNAYMVYDNAGRKVADVDHYGYMTEYKYDADDRVVATVRYATALTSSQLTTLQNPSAAFPLASNRPSANAGDLWSWTVYDKESRVIETIDGTGHATAFDYDGSGQLIRTTAYYTTLSSSLATFRSTPPTALTLPAADAAHDMVSRVFYDKSGRVIGTLDGEGYIAATSYDGAGRKIAETAFANVTGGNRATDSFNTLLASAGTSAADRVVHYVYDGQGLLVFTVDTLNHVTEFVYPGQSLADVTGDVRQTIQYAGVIATPSAWTIAAVRTALSNAGLSNNVNNRVAWAVYDTRNNLTYAIDAAGAVTGYKYDSAGNVTKATRYATLRATSTLPSSGDMDSWAGTYAAAGDRVTRNYYDARGALRYAIDAEGFVSRIDYDAAGRAVGTVRWDTAISASDSTTIAQVAAAASGASTTTATTYDNDGRVATSTDGEGFVVRYTYNGNGTLASVDRAYGTADQAQTAYLYDGAGRVVAQYDANGSSAQRVTSFAYDGLGNLLTTTDPTGAVTTRGYDRAGRLLSQTDALSGVTSFQYDAFDQVVKTTDPRGAVTYSYYDTLGRVVAVRDAEDYVTESGYTVFGELQSVTRRANKATNAASVGTLPTYTASGADATTGFAYDKLGRVVTATDAAGATETTSYNAFGQATQTVGKLGLVTDMSYDRRGSLTLVHVNAAVYNAAGSQVAAGYDSHRYQYDARGNVIADTEAYGLAEQRVTTFVYDRLDRMIERHLPAVQNATNTGTVSPVEYVKYDGRGNVIESKDAAGARTLTYYDKLGRVVVQINPIGSYQTFAYADVPGTGSTVTARSYDTAVTLPATAGGTPPAVPSGAYRETVTSYDRLGRQVTQAVTNAFVGAWNGASYATTTATLTTTWQYDAAGNVVQTTAPSQAAAYSYYDKLGRAITQVDAAGYMTSWTRDAEGNVQSERRYATAASGTTVGTPPTVATAADDRVTNFTYDKMGRRLTETRVNVGGWSIDNATTGSLIQTAPNNIASDATITYTYNALGEVLSKREATGDVTGYTYDSAGRMTATTGAAFYDYTNNWVQGAFAYSYNALGNVVRTVQNAARTTTYAYGAGGRLQSMTDPAGAVHGYYYDIVGHKTGESWDRTKSDGATVLHEGLSYQYDLAGNLVRQAFATVSGGTFSDAGDVTTLTYNNHHEVTARGLNGITQEQNAYDNAGHLWRSTAGDGVSRYYIYDANGNRTAQIDDEGNTGVNMINRTLADVVYIASNYGSGTIGSAYIDGLNATITSYDARNLATTAIQTKRQINETAAASDITSGRTYNAFGEVATETDALGHVTTYVYNRMGRATSVARAAVTVGNADGTTSTNQTPTDTYYYDLSGRLVGQRDANGFLTSRTLLAGTGYGQAAALVIKEYHPDSGVVTNAYDVFGDQRTVTDALGRATISTYDAMGRLNQVNHFGGLVDYYTNDVLGQRTRHYNNVLGSGVVETSDYDVQGRVTAVTSFGGDTTTTSYSWNASLVTTGFGSFGGYVQTTTYANGKTATDKTDGFGHVISHTDLGGHVNNTTYDTAGRIVARSQDLSAYSYLNTGLVGHVTIGATNPNDGYTAFDDLRSTYGYDKLGEKLTETTIRETGQYMNTGYQYDPDFGYYPNYEYVTSALTLQNATAGYDALGRMTSWAESGTAVSGTSYSTVPVAAMTWSYDKVGNIRHTTASYRYLDQNGTASGTASTQDLWYLYDGMNRVTTSKGVLSGATIVRGSQGTDILYDVAGQRVRATTSAQRSTQIANPYFDYGSYANGWGGDPYMTAYYTADVREDYTYAGDGSLATVRVAESQASDNYDGTVTVTPPSGTGALKGTYSYDLLGRLTRQQDWLADGSGVAFDRQVSYDNGGRITSETDISRQGNDTYTSYVYNSYGSGSTYALGAVTSSSSSNYKNGSYQSASTTTTGYAWYDGAVQSTVQYQSNYGQPTYTTSYAYNATGSLVSAYVGDGRPRSVTVTNDALGQVIRRDEADNNYNSSTGGDPHELWYRFNGKQIGYVGNNGTEDLDYASSIARRTQASGGTGAFKNGASYMTAYADFDQNYAPINSYEQGGSGGSYTVRTGDSLATIAAQLWGDAGLWYKLAGANGLSGDSALSAGATLNIPTGVSKAGNSATTFKPYDVSDAYGDTSPTTPAPQAAAKKNKCGTFGIILLVVIAIAVTVVTSGALAAAAASSATGTSVSLGAGIGMLAGGSAAGVSLTTVGLATFGAIGAVAGSVVSQAVGVATGIQSKFDWKGVALAGISGGIGGALGGIFPGGGILGAAARGAAGSGLTQGIGVATGLQPKFDWAGVAAAGIGAGVGSWAGQQFGAGPLTDLSLQNIAANFGENAVGGIANAATRSIITGTDFGDNLMAALPDIIGQTIGNIITGSIQASSELTEKARSAANELDPTILDDPNRFAEFRHAYKGTLANIRSIDFGDNPYKNADALADAYSPLLMGYAADKDAAAHALTALRTPQDTQLADAYVGAGDAYKWQSGAMLAALDSRSDSITITGQRYTPRGPALGLKLLDSLAIQAGNLGVEVGQAYQSLPLWARLGVTALGWAVDAAAGPIAFAIRRTAGYLVGKATEAVADAVSKRFSSVGYSPTQAALGGVGAVLVGTMVFAGATAARSLLAAGSLGRWASGIKSRLVQAIRRPQAELRPYGGPGGGHHAPAKKAFEDVEGYDPNAALAIPNSELARLGLKHTTITAAQQQLYRAFSKTGKALTWGTMQDIETQALVRAGMRPSMASATVRTAISALKAQGVRGPSKIPWGGK